MDDLERLAIPTPIGPRVSLGAYAEHWLALNIQRLSRGSRVSYGVVIERHIKPHLGHVPIADVRRPLLKRWLAAHTQRYARKTLLRWIAVLTSILQSAVEDELLATNPAQRLGRTLGPRTREREVKALSTEQLAVLLAVVRGCEPEHFLRFQLLAYTGLRIGEASGLFWSDWNPEARILEIRRQLTEHGDLEGLKTRAGIRDLDVPWALAEALAAEKAKRREASFRVGDDLRRMIFWPEFSEGCTGPQVRGRRKALNAVMGRLLRLAELPVLTCHALRHTWASAMLARGRSLNYVSRKLGHETLGITEELYGRWLPMRDVAGVDDFADAVEVASRGQKFLRFP